MTGDVTARVAASLAPLREICGARSIALAEQKVAAYYDERVWSPSRLTLEGFPVELTFRSGDATLAFTCDVDGSWIGTRLRGDRMTTKRYVEVPDDQATRTRIASRIGAPLHAGRCRMIAESDDAFEAYLRIDGMKAWALRMLLAPLSLQHLDGLLLDALEDSCGTRLRDELPSATGFSYAISGDALPRFTLYMFASSMFGGDGRTRAALLRVARRREWPFEAYERFSAPLAARGGAENSHGLFGITIDGRGVPEMRIGCTPPAQAITRG